MKLKYLLAASAVSLTAATAFAPTAAHAQQITSGIEGRVTSEDGAPLGGASVVITDTRTGQTRTLEAGADGNFRAVSLVPGGPYTITATASGYEGQTVEGVNTSVSGNTSLSFRLASTATGDSDNVIVVSGARAGVTQLAVGPGQSFGADALEGFPSISRDIRDIVRLDPRVSLERSSEVDRISCLGGNDRSNSFTVDGIIQSDSFGLTDTPFAARSALPVPFDVVRETSVEFAPFDVEYGQFTGCTINVITKSGGNDFHGSAFFTFRNDDLRGDTVDGRDASTLPFEEKRWGATLSGPIIKDRLFFFVGYEETDLPDPFDRGPEGSGLANEVDFVTQAQFDEFAQIARDVYGQDVGGYPRITPDASTRYFARVDALITDGQRLELSYQKLDEAFVTSDTGSNNLTGINSFNEQGTLSDYYSARLYSDWTDNFSTEISFARSDITDRQGPFGFNEQQDENPTVRLAVGVVGPGDNGLLTTGPGIFRSANALEQTIDQFKAKANLLAGDHEFTLGFEVNKADFYNLFAINATGTLFFQNLDDFREGLLTNGSGFPSGFTGADDVVDNEIDGAAIASTGSGDINEAAAEFSRTIWTAYVQDQWQLTDQLNVLIGGRVDWYSGDAPRANPLFLQRYGYTNATSFGRFDPLFLPRLGFTYDLFNEGFFEGTVIKGGIGVFGGGDPTVWFSNAFSNTGFSTAEGTTLDAACAGLARDANGQIDVVVNGVFTGIPQCAIDAGSAVAAQGAAPVQSTDPNFKLPSVVRANIGLETTFGADEGFFSNWNLNLDYIYSKFRNPVNWVDLTYALDYRAGDNGFLVDGRPVYSSIDPLIAGCDATYVSPGVWKGVTDVCFNTRREDEYMLTNAGSFESHVASIILSKNFQGGLFTEAGNFRVNLGYAWTDAENRREARSSTASSNFGKSATFDVLDPAVSPSNYQTRHVATFAANLREEFFGDYGTELGLVFVARSGRPYSLTFDGAPFTELSSSRDQQLLYVPSGVNDPNVSPLSDAASVQSLIDYVAASGCDYTPGETIKRNTCRSDWYFDMDLRIAQELPGPGKFFGIEDRFTLFADFDNVLNMLDNSWNVFRSVPGGTFGAGDGALVDVVDGGFDSEGRYRISGFNPDDRDNVGTSASVWKIQVGVRYEF
ncbi:carboxypeptidase regulatory-like domain-containing protein [Altererythrobacter sp. GH1-8]|uniref:TonB-dependent receptor n=1 Tax=Altererythrobacter sp. GH1-8 TaxID=3349333 RepID=UPI00374DAA3E